MSNDAQGPIDPFDAPLPELAFLGPDSDGSEIGLPDQLMPGDVWERLAAAIAAEPPLIVAGPLATVTAMSPRRRTRWVSGLVAASVAFLALGVVVQAVRTPSTEVVVADAATKGMTSDQAGTTQTEATQAEATKLDSAPLESGEPNTMAGVSGQTMPARPTPLGPEVDDDRLLTLQHICGETFVRDLDGRAHFTLPCYRGESYSAAAR